MLLSFLNYKILIMNVHYLLQAIQPEPVLNMTRSRTLLNSTELMILNTSYKSYKNSLSSYLLVISMSTSQVKDDGALTSRKERKKACKFFTKSIVFLLVFSVEILFCYVCVFMFRLIYLFGKKVVQL
jgi:hypothetical protein